MGNNEPKGTLFPIWFIVGQRAKKQFKTIADKKKSTIFVST